MNRKIRIMVVLDKGKPVVRRGRKASRVPYRDSQVAERMDQRKRPILGERMGFFISSSIGTSRHRRPSCLPAFGGYGLQGPFSSLVTIKEKEAPGERRRGKRP